MVRTPGAFELPLAALKFAASGLYHAVIALGCVIRGDTPHFEYVAGECARGLMDAGLASGVPVISGVLTTETQAQAGVAAETKGGAEARRDQGFLRPRSEAQARQIVARRATGLDGVASKRSIVRLGAVPWRSHRGRCTLADRSPAGLVARRRRRRGDRATPNKPATTVWRRRAPMFTGRSRTV